MSSFLTGYDRLERVSKHVGELCNSHDRFAEWPVTPSARVNLSARALGVAGRSLKR